jgi:carotene biosynthesis associated membrane protein
VSTPGAVRPAPSTSTPRPAALRLLPGVLAAAAVLVQMVFPFTDGGTRTLTVLAVLLLTATAVSHAALTRGARASVLLVVVATGGGLVAEAVGVRTGLPFGDYDYTGTLGAELLGVPLVVPLAWTMMAYPALLVARRLATGRVAVALVGAWALTAWDVFLDPQMVDAGHWTWAHPRPSLPGVEGIPVSNFAGWFVVSLLLVAVLDRVLDGRGGDGVPVAVYLWTYGSSVMAHALFFGRPSVALVGGLVMGVVAVPLAARVLRPARPARSATRSATRSAVRAATRARRRP